MSAYHEILEAFRSGDNELARRRSGPGTRSRRRSRAGASPWAAQARAGRWRVRPPVRGGLPPHAQRCAEQFSVL